MTPTKDDVNIVNGQRLYKGHILAPLSNYPQDTNNAFALHDPPNELRKCFFRL